MKLTKQTFNIYAAQNYNNPRCVDIKEYKEDFSHFKYLKKHLGLYKKTGKLQERLVLNHLIIIHNVFKIEAATQMCFFKLDEDLHATLKTFLLYLNYIRSNDYPHVGVDPYAVSLLQKI